MKQEVDKLGDDISLKNAELLKENQRNSELEGKKNELFESKRKLEKKARKLEQIINESKAEI